MKTIGARDPKMGWRENMPEEIGTRDESAQATRLWKEYVRTHDLTHRLGHTAGIDPKTRRVWIGDSIEDVVAQRDADGIDSPLFFERIGSDTYYRKGGHR
jgi:hypothetical protein